MTTAQIYPVLWSFRRCPYAMRARLALQASQIHLLLREIQLRDKPTAFTDMSSKATVPVLILPNGQMIDESSSIMFWALRQSDPFHWLDAWHKDFEFCNCFIDELDSSFKYHLDRYKYASRFPNDLSAEHRLECLLFLNKIDYYLQKSAGFLFGEYMGFLDAASLPFIRQFRLADQRWFDSQPWKKVHNWLNIFLNSDGYAAVMQKYPTWNNGEAGILLPKQTLK